MAMAGRGEAISVNRRDPRLDLWRGLALMMIFIDHVPGNAAAALTLKSFGFSDAAEIFVFLAGYAAMLAYGGRFRRDGVVAGARVVLARVLKLYGAHLALVAGVLILVAGFDAVARHGGLAGDLGLDRLLTHPGASLPALATLQYLPRFLDILPLYVLLLGALPVLLPLVQRHRWATLAGSAALFAATRVWDLNPSSGVGGEAWPFNPFAWQLLFVIGLVAADRARETGAVLPANAFLTRWLDRAAALILITGFVLAAPWDAVPALRSLTLVDPEWVFSFDKPNLSLVRLGHFLALAYAAARLVRRDAAWLESGWATALRNAGRQSLSVFGVGLLLSVSGIALLREYGDGWLVQLIINSCGIVTLIAVAAMLTHAPNYVLEARARIARLGRIGSGLGDVVRGVEGKAGVARLG